jgi:hypothetical protein
VAADLQECSYLLRSAAVETAEDLAAEDLAVVRVVAVAEEGDRRRLQSQEQSFS